MNTPITLTELEHKHRCAVRWLLAYRKKVGLKEFQIFIRSEKTIKLWFELKKDFNREFEDLEKNKED